MVDPRPVFQMMMCYNSSIAKLNADLYGKDNLIKRMSLSLEENAKQLKMLNLQMGLMNEHMVGLYKNQVIFQDTQDKIVSGLANRQMDVFHESGSGQKRTIEHLELNENRNEEEVNTSEGASTNNALNAWEYVLENISNSSMGNFLFHWFDLKVEESYSNKPKITDITLNRKYQMDMCRWKRHVKLISCISGIEIEKSLVTKLVIQNKLINGKENLGSYLLVHLK